MQEQCHPGVVLVPQIRSHYTCPERSDLAATWARNWNQSVVAYQIRVFMVKPPPPAYLSQLFLGFLTRDTIFASLITYCDMFLVCCSRRSLESTLNKNLVSNHMPPCTTVYGTGDENSQVNIGLLPATQNCGLRMRRECRERFPHHR